jgi:hypothetical protein
MRSTYANLFSMKRKLDFKCFNIPLSYVVTGLRIWFYFPFHLHFLILHMIIFAALYVKLGNTNINRISPIQRYSQIVRNITWQPKKNSLLFRNI